MPEIKQFNNKDIIKSLSNFTKIFDGFLFVSFIFLILVNIMLTHTVKGKTAKNFIKNERIFCQGCNVILISLDALRAQELPCYGYIKDTAPNMCNFAEKNLLFKNTYAQSSFTLDSHMSLITSLYPTSHNMRVPTRDVLNQDIKTFAQVLQENNYRTIYIGPTTDPTLPIDKGFERGFSEIIDQDSDFESLKKLIYTLDSNSSQSPSFIFFHTYDIHGPYFLPEDYSDPVFAKGYSSFIPTSHDELNKVSWEFISFALDELKQRIEESDTKESLARNLMFYQGLKDANTLKEAEDFINNNYKDDIGSLFYWWYYRFVNVDDPEQIAHLQSLYDEKIYVTDKKLNEIFKLIDNLGLKNNTIVILTSDHGEEFYEHGEFDHVFNIYETETRIPWIMSVPGVTSFASDQPVQSIDIFPTTIGLLNIKVPDQAQGLNLTSYIYGGAYPVLNRTVISEHHNASVKSIKFGNWRLYTKGINYDPIELYNTSQDSLEQKDVLNDNPSIAQNLRSKLIETLDSLKIYPQENEGFPDWIDEKQRKKLIDEGYF